MSDKIITPWNGGPVTMPASETFMRDQEIARLRDELKLKDTLIKGQAERIAAQNEILAKNAQKTEAPIDQHEGKKYLRKIVGVTPTVTYVTVGGVTYPMIDVDVYKVLVAFGVESQPIGQALKKLLACGVRGKGDVLSDLRGVLAAVSRAVEEEQIRQAQVPMSKESKEWFEADKRFMEELERWKKERPGRTVIIEESSP